MSLVGESLEAHYRYLSNLSFTFGFQINEIENLMPFELDLIIDIRREQVQQQAQEK